MTTTRDTNSGFKADILRSAAIILEFSDSNPYIHRVHKHTAASFLQAI